MRDWIKPAEPVRIEPLFQEIMGWDAALCDRAAPIVRPAESAGSSDGFRSMDRSTFQMKKDAAERGRAIRTAYVDAIRDWVAKGEQSEYVLSAAEVRKRINAPVKVDPLATANFRLGQYLHQQGHLEAAKRYFQETRRLCPERWNYLRQTMQLEEDGSASGPEFFRAIDALGDRPFYPPVELKGARG